MILENKLEETFPYALYHLKDFSNPYRLGRSSYGVGILVYIRDKIPSNLSKFTKRLKTTKVSLLN